MKCLVAVADPARERGLIEVALRVAGDGEVLLVSVIEVPENGSLTEAQPEARARRLDLATLQRSLDTTTRTRAHVKVARDGWAAVQEIIGTERPDLLLVAWRRPGWDFLGTTIEAILRQPPCDVAVVKGAFARTKRVLIPVRGGRYADLAVRVGSAFARSRGGSVTLLHVEPPGDQSSTNPFPMIGRRGADPVIEQVITRIGEAPPIIRDELEGHDGIVLGATAREGAADQVGPIGSVILQSGKPAIIVRTRTPLAANSFRRAKALPADQGERNRVVSEMVDRWFVENTFTSAEFADLRRLVAEKERQGLRISVGLPTLNEEATIAKVIRAIRTRLMSRLPLIDELVVIDSNSTDRTRDIAREEGVPVHIHQEVLPEYGAYSGKGEALWKSLHVLSGDLVIWVDTDVSNFHPKFVYGIVGPLLLRPDISFVKAFYRRPLKLGGGELSATGGGRVTELSARPILNLFYPELSGMIQPLSGEQGGRRALLEQVPFFTGYGVETGLLIDVLKTSGLEAIAQVDMKQRIHRNQSLFALSKMSFQILQVALRRVGEARGVLFEDANSTMKLISPIDAKRFHLEMEDISVVERPPMLTLPAYRAKRGL